MFFLFSFQASEKLEMDVLDFGFLHNCLFWSGFDLVFQTCNNSHTYIFSDSNLSMIKFFALFFSIIDGYYSIISLEYIYGQ